MTREELIAALEKAEEPSRKLDAEIAITANIVPPAAFRMFNAGDDGLFGTGAHTTWRAPAFSSSIDAALTLVPDGTAWSIGSDGDGLTTDKRPFATCSYTEDGRRKVAWGVTPAIALCIAALKARGGTDGR